MINRFMDSKAGLSPTSVKGYLSTLTRFKKFCEKRNVKMYNADKATLAAYIAQWNSGRSDTRLTYIKILRSYFSFLVDEGIRQKNPCKGLEKQFKGNARRSKKRIVEKDMLRKMLAACRDLREKTIVVSMWYSGTRSRELLAARIEDVDLEDGYFFVSESKSSAGNRSIPINTRWLPFLKKYAKRRSQIKFKKGKEHNFFFVNSRMDRLKYKTALNLIHRLCKDVEIPKLGTHAFRRGFITNLYRRDKDIMLAKTIAGHESVATTQNYIVLTDEEIDTVRDLDI